ncbi:MAG: hypothetical protein V9G12_04835 [Microthrixaceae bacterium]
MERLAGRAREGVVDQLGDRDREVDPEDRKLTHHVEPATDPVDPDQLQGSGAALHTHRAQQPGEPQHVVAVEMGDQDGREPRQLQRTAHDLLLGALAAVDEDPLTAEVDPETADVPRRRRATQQRRTGSALTGPG